MDLLDQDAVDDFKSAMRDVTDTFHRVAVTLIRAAGGEQELLAGVKPAGDAQGGSDGELRAGGAGEEIEERRTVTFNRGYLVEKGLVDQAGKLLITVDDRLKIAGKRYYLAAVREPAVFRDGPLLVVCEAVR